MLSIIIVSWNVRELLEKCLSSLIATVPDEQSFEIIVIDNASRDGTPAMIKTSFPRVHLIGNSTNKGFAAACNQGLRVAKGEYIALLNPDTEVHKETFSGLIEFLKNHSEVGIVGPLIRHENGDVQPSVRGFPTPISGLLAFLKLGRLMRFLPVVRRYQALDFDYSKTQEVDQPMGACLVIRKEVFEKIGTFDEQFFLWFEEVDFCKRAKDAGYKIYFIAESSVTHHGGRSFRQRDILTRQKNFYESCTKYLRKHFSRSITGWIIAVLFSLYTRSLGFFQSIANSIPEQKISSLFHYTSFVWAFILTGAAEFLSLLVYSDIVPQRPIFFFILSLVGITAVIRPHVAASVLLSELVIGSKGYLFSIDSWDGRVGIRMGIFGVIGAVWFVRIGIGFIRTFFQRNPLPQISFLQSRFLWWYVSLGLVIVYGAAKAFITTTPTSLIVQDGNAWLFFLIAPVLYDTLKTREALAKLFSVLLAALLVQTINVFLTYYIMGHQGFGEFILASWYYWIRQTGVGEITALPSTMTRVFFQSQIYALISGSILFTYIIFYWRSALEEQKESLRSAFTTVWARHRFFIFFCIAISASLIVSFSRSFWMALIGTGFIMVLYCFARKFSLSVIAASLGSMVLCAICAIAILIGISSIPVPTTSGVFDIQSLGSRVENLESEKAAVSRWKLLPVLVQTIRENPLSGYGFGKTVSYQSEDPRVKERYGGGLYTTYAFEWGYLDFWIKFGLLGFLIILGFALALVLHGFHLSAAYIRKRQEKDGILILAFTFGLLALFATHVFTPYLNHPLGIGMVILVSLIFDRWSEGV